MSTKCPDCGHVSPGDPRICPGCGREVRRFDPSRCEFCGSRISPEAESCGNCGAPVQRGSFVPEQSVTPAPSSYSRSIRVGCTAAAVLLAILTAGLVIAVSGTTGRHTSEASGTETAEEHGAVVTEAPRPDSVYTGFIEEDRNTVETVWPGVLTALPDSCYYPSPYDPCAAFRFAVGGRRILAKIEASAPFDLVMTLLREDEAGLSYVAWNEDGPTGTDPLIMAPLSEGTYIALVTNLGGWEFGRVRFLWSVVMEEIPLVTRDTTFSVSLSSTTPVFHFDIDIVRGRTYSIRTVSESRNMDAFVQLTTREGSILSDDDSGRNDNCWGDANLTFTAGPLQEGMAFVVVRPYSMYSPSYSDMEVVVTTGTP